MGGGWRLGIEVFPTFGPELAITYSRESVLRMQSESTLLVEHYKSLFNRPPISPSRPVLE